MVADGGERGTSCRLGCGVHLLCIDLPYLEALFGDLEADIPGLVLSWASLCIKATGFLPPLLILLPVDGDEGLPSFLSGTRIRKLVG
jgi:hypothetical protein